MHKCIKCNKEFEFESDYMRHKNRKTSCNEIKNTYECSLCSIKFKYKSKFIEHEKTNKHILNIQKSNNNNNNNNNIKEEQIDYKFKYEQLLQQFTTINNEKINADKRIQELENQFKLLEQLSNKELNNTEYIYIIHERTFVKTNTNIYKIGKTKNIKTRLNGYSKGSKLLFTIPCKDCSLMETQILNYLKSNDNFIQAKEYGNEYFICDLNILINDIHNLVKNEN